MGRDFNGKRSDSMIVKTRSNFFLKFTNRKIIIRKKDFQQHAFMSKVEYDYLMKILAEFRDAKEVQWQEQDSLYFKMLKFALDAKLVVTPYLKETQLSDFIVKNIENRFDNFSDVLIDLEKRSFSFKNCSEKVSDFFQSQGMVDNSGSEIISVYGNDSIESAPLGSFCIFENNGRYLYFLKTNDADIGFYKGMMDSFPVKAGRIGSWIHPFYTYIFLTNQLYGDNRQTRAASIVFEDGMIVELPQGNRLNATVSNYERSFAPKKDEDIVTKIRILESLFLKLSFLIKQINSTETSRNNQLSVAQYQIDFIDDYRFISTNLSFKNAAMDALTHSLENFLNEMEGENGSGVWISEIDQHLFYIRGVASLLESNGKIYELIQLTPPLLQLIEEIKPISKFSEIKAGVEYIFQHDVVRVFVTNESDEVLYRSEITTDIVESLNRGLTRIMSDVANNELSSEGTISFEKEKVVLETQQRNSQDILDELMETVKDIKISEKPWFYQPLFESFGLYIGKFQMEAR